MAKKRINSDGVTVTKGKSVKEAFDEIDLDAIGKDHIRNVNFDAHSVTEKALQFGKILTGVPLYKYQEDTAYAILYSLLTFDNATLSMLFSRQSGKTETLSFIINTASVLFPALANFIPDLEPYKNGITIGLFAPQSDQVWTTYNRALLRLTSENASAILGDPDLEISLDRPTKYELSNGSRLVAQVASKQSKIEGATYSLVIIEEAQDVDTYIVQKSIEPMVSATAGTIVKCGTTGTSKNHFWHDIQYNRNNDRKQKDPRKYYHWEFDYKRIIQDKRLQYDKDGKIYHLNYEKDIAKKIARYGKDSQVFRLNYALAWDLESGMLITDKEFDQLTNNKKGHKFDQTDVIIAGLDIGKEEASTVMTFAKVIWEPNEEDAPPKKEIIGWLELHKMDYDAQHHMIINALYEYNVVSLYADYTGVGKAVVDRLMAAIDPDSINIEPFTFSRPSKSEMWYNLIEHIQAKRLIIPANKQVRATQEFQNFEEQFKNCLKYFDNSYLVCHKSDGFLDDYVDSLALMCMADNFEISDEIEEEVFNPFFAAQLENRNLRADK